MELQIRINHPPFRCWIQKTGELKFTLSTDLPNDIQPLAFSPDGKTLVSKGKEKHTLKFWDANTGELKQMINTSPHNISYLIFSPDSQVMAASESHAIRL